MLGMGSRLRALRKENGWTIEITAQKLKLGISTYAGYEEGRRTPSVPVLIKLSQLFGVSTDYLLGLTKERDIKRLEYDVSLYLTKSGLHWDGVPLTEEELRPIRNVLKLIAERKSRHL